MRRFFHKPQTLHRLELQTTILIEDACVDTDAQLQPHTRGTIWKNDSLKLNMTDTLMATRWASLWPASLLF